MSQGIKRGQAAKVVAVVAVIIIVALLLFTPTVQSFLRDLISSPFNPRYPESSTFTLQRSLTVDANGGDILGYNFDISEPETIVQNGFTLQNVTDISYIPVVTSSEVRYGQRWVEWNGTAFGGDQERTCVVTYEVTVKSKIWDIEKDGSRGISYIPSYLKGQYIHDQWSNSHGEYKINVTSPLIRSTAEQIVGNETNSYQVLKSIYDWMTVNIRYPTGSTGGEPQSAVQTLLTKVGDCDDQSILFCSLARAAGVPAWLQMGALYVEAESSWGGHGWVQAYVPLASGGGENVTIDVVNKDFMVFKSNRFIDFTDDGNGTHLSDYYYTFSTTYDPTTYDLGKVPMYSDEYTSLGYEESTKTISRGNTYSMGPELMLACIFRR